MTLATLAASAVLGQSAPVLTKTKIVDAAIFMNGSTLTVREVTVPASGEVLVEDPPKAASGTLWIFGDGKSRIESVVMTTVVDNSETRVSVSTVAQALEANIGKTMDIRWVDHSERRTINGVVKSIANGLVVIEETGSLERNFINLTAITSFKGGSDLVYERVQKLEKSTAALRIRATAGSVVRLMGLQKGAVWTPAYYFDISDPKKMQIVAKATVVNELADLNGINVRLVTGFPNVISLGQLDALTDYEVFGYPDGFYRGAGRSSSGLLPEGTQGLTYKPAMNELIFRDESGRVSGVGDGFRGEDLFFTPLNNVTLKMGERGYYVLFQAESEYEHVYTLNLPVSTEEDSPEVWHEIELKNNEERPWTPGSAFVVKDGQMMGQDSLSYTAPGMKTAVKISKALDIATDASEEEISRERGALKDREGEPTHDLVTVRGRVELQNFKDSDVQMRITKEVLGEVDSAIGSERVLKTAKRLNQVNANSMIEWRPLLKKGEKRTFEYTYKVYIASN